MMEDHLRQTTVISLRRSQKTLAEQTASRTEGNTAKAIESSTQAREQQEEARLAFDQKCQDAAGAETIYDDAIKNTLAKTEAPEKHVKTVTMRAESLATTEADFFTTLLDRQEETQKHLNELAAPLSHQNTATRSTEFKTCRRRKGEGRREEHGRPLEHT